MTTAPPSTLEPAGGLPERAPAAPGGAPDRQRTRGDARPGSRREQGGDEAGTRSLAKAYLELTKPRITLLLLVTCVAAMFCAERGMPPLDVLVFGALGLALSSGGASALNHVLDRDIDRLMRRTATRPVASGDVGAAAGAAFGIGLMVAAGLLLWFAVNPLTSILALAGGLFYVVVYTLVLKRTTPQNIVIGGAAGAAPPLVGWAAVDGSLGLLAWELFAIIFWWTPPHFWALALLIREDYAKAGVPMLPVVAGEQRTVREIWWYSLILVAGTLMPVATGHLGVVYAVVALGLAGWLLVRVQELRTAAAAIGPDETLVVPGSRGHAAARGVFLASMGYLALLFLAAVVDRVAWHVPLI